MISEQTPLRRKEHLFLVVILAITLLTIISYNELDLGLTPPPTSVSSQGHSFLSILPNSLTGAVTADIAPTTAVTNGLVFLSKLITFMHTYSMYLLGILLLIIITVIIITIIPTVNRTNTPNFLQSITHFQQEMSLNSLKEHFQSTFIKNQRAKKEMESSQDKTTAKASLQKWHGRKKIELQEELGTVNTQLQQLQAMETYPEEKPYHPKLLHKESRAIEEALTQELEQINQEIQGYKQRQPIILEDPQQGAELRARLAQVEEQLESIQQEPQEKETRTSRVSRQKFPQHRSPEGGRLAQEYSRITELLRKSAQDPKVLLPNLFQKQPSPEEVEAEQETITEVKHISAKNKDTSPLNELYQIEEEIKQLRKELRGR